jgi:hypothetical protein
VAKEKKMEKGEKGKCRLSPQRRYDWHKYVHGLYKVSRPKFQLSEGKNTRGHSLKRNKEHCRLNIRSNFFSQRVVNAWNSLPGSVVSAPTVNSFISRFDAFWHNSPAISIMLRELKTIFLVAQYN